MAWGRAGARAQRGWSLGPLCQRGLEPGTAGDGAQKCVGDFTPKKGEKSPVVPTFTSVQVALRGSGPAGCF